VSFLHTNLVLLHLGLYYYYLSRFYFPGFLVGPSLEFTSYMDLINETVFKTVDATGKLKRGRIPSGRKRVAYTKFVTGLAFLGAFVLYGSTFNYFVLLKPWFKAKPYWYQFLYFQLCGFFERSKYYAIWTLTEVRLAPFFFFLEC
jgi:lysophospholipid acyltransferase